nr:hypothetical protein [uncultured Undibacterium sp.]
MTTQLPAWTHEEGLNFECARELITDLLGIVTAERTSEIDPVKIAALNMQSRALFQERSCLHVQNQDQIKMVIQKYADTVRLHYEEHKLLIFAQSK